MVESLNKRIEENADKMIQSLCEVVQIPQCMSGNRSQEHLLEKSHAAHCSMRWI